MMFPTQKTTAENCTITWISVFACAGIHHDPGVVASADLGRMTITLYL